ncbi:MAG: hypothetical protein JWQ60_6469 [Pseudonocardia sp.]|nr:hypothetical protein [Pseudonocardia sp.]
MFEDFLALERNTPTTWSPFSSRGSYRKNDVAATATTGGRNYGGSTPAAQPRDHNISVVQQHNVGVAQCHDVQELPRPRRVPA